MTPTPTDPVTLLMILDGWGISPPSNSNAVHMAATPFLDHLMDRAPHCRLTCSGPSVGLPEGTMGNSEVGHMNIGAGRTVPQDLMRINQAIEDGTFFRRTALGTAMAAVSGSRHTLHLLGLLSDGGVHSHIRHLLALVDMAGDQGVANVCIHAVTDGRDTPPKSGITYLDQLCRHLSHRPFARVQSIVGRYWAMDRDTRWDRVQKAYDLMTRGMGERRPNPMAALQHAYDRGMTDEFIPPIFLERSPGSNQGTVRDGDAVIFFNFRADRAREITRAFTQTHFSEFHREKTPTLSTFVTMTRYDDTFDLPVAFGPLTLTRILGEELSRRRIPQLRMAETEKYAHVTYFFNGGEETVFPGEERILIPSPREVDTYDEKPEMSAPELSERACQEIRSGRFRFVVLNFANMDMVGHTGVLSAAITACETVDRCVRQVVRAVWDTGGTAFITADHGNSEQMTAPDGSPHTAHTLNPVPFIIADKTFTPHPLGDGMLGDIAPTVLQVMGLPQPGEMTGSSLIRGSADG